MNKVKKGLGRGLETLLGQQISEKTIGNQVTALRLDRIKTSQHQPRTEFDEGALEDLANSIRTHGVLQPIIVRPDDEGQYELIAGERRLRAARIIGLETIPAIVKEVSEIDHQAIALIENIQRENLNALEEAYGMNSLLNQHGLTHEQIANILGRSRSSISNSLRLLHLSPPVQAMLKAGDLDMGHARCLLCLPVDRQLEIANQIIQQGLSVRATEKLVAQIHKGKTTDKEKKQNTKTTDVLRLESRLSEQFAMPIQIAVNDKGKGKITISVSSLDEIDRFLSIVGYNEEGS